jgi:hypothetical protein
MRTSYYNIWLLCFFMIGALAVQAQEKTEPTARLRGQVLDKDSEEPIAEARVELLNFSPPKVVQTDAKGFFEIKNIGVGRYRVMVSKLRYSSQVFSDLVVGASEMEATKMPIAALSEQALVAQEEEKKAENTEKERVVYLKTAKDVPFSQMIGAAIRPFTVEEVTRYAGSRFDLARLTNNFAGVSNNYDARNDIVIRGNSPAYLTWQIEELPVTNPNHIISLGMAGGTVSAINIHALGRADFSQGSFAAQHGNSIAGVFDLQLRQGNSKHLSFLGQIGTQRAEILVEGPLSRKENNTASFMISVRHSVGSYLYDAIVYNIPRSSPAYQRILDWADPMHRDINFKLHFGKIGKHEFELFGIVGLSELYIPQWRGALRDKIRYQIFENEDFRTSSLMGLLGLKHTWRKNNKFLWRTIAGATMHNSSQDWTSNIPNSTTMSFDEEPSFLSDDKRRNYLLHTYIQYKPNNDFMLRLGAQTNVHDLDLYEHSYLDDYSEIDYRGIFALNRAYAQTKWQPHRKFSIFAGVNSQYYSLTKELVAEPRLALQYEPSPHHSFSLAGGLYHQTQHLLTQFSNSFIDVDSSGSVIQDYSAINLKANRSIHGDFEYRWIINNNWRLKLGAYLQLLDRIAIERGVSSAFSMLNTGESFFDFYSRPLSQTGKGRNMGVELTIEKYFSKGFYALFTATLYDSKGQGSDGIWRNTVFNNRYIINFLVGREFVFGKLQQNVFFVDWRFCTRGGRPYTPIDAQATFEQGFQNGGLEEVFIDSLANMRRTPAFYQVDFKIGFRFNDLQRKTTHTLRLDLFNIFDIKNVLTYRYNAVYDPIFGQTQQGQVVPIYQRGFIPDITYSIQF